MQKKRFSMDYSNFVRNFYRYSMSRLADFRNYYGKFVLDFAQKSHNLQNKIINKNYFISYYNSLYYQILQNNLP